MNLDRPVLASIIIPHHNRPDMLEALLAGVPDRQDLEVLVVDDRSDAFPAPTRSFARTHLRVIPSRTPTAGGARNTGIQEARGRWLVFADSDDLIDTQPFNAVLHAIKSSQADLVACPPRSFLHPTGGVGTRHLRPAQLVESIHAGAPAGALAAFIPPWSKCVQAEFVRAHKLWFEAVPVSNDVLFNARLMAAKPRIEAMDVVFYAVREGNVALTGRVDPDALEVRIEQLNAANALLRAAGLGQHQAVAGGHIVRLARHNPMAAWALTRKLWKGGGRLLPRDAARWASWLKGGRRIR